MKQAFDVIFTTIQNIRRQISSKTTIIEILFTLQWRYKTYFLNYNSLLVFCVINFKYSYSVHFIDVEQWIVINEIMNFGLHERGDVIALISIWNRCGWCFSWTFGIISFYEHNNSLVFIWKSNKMCIILFCIGKSTFAARHFEFFIYYYCWLICHQIMSTICFFPSNSVIAWCIQYFVRWKSN